MPIKKDGDLKKYIGGRSCALLGLGVSNTPLAEYLTNQKIPLSVYDKNDVSLLGEKAAELHGKGVAFHKFDGEHTHIEGELIFRSPGIRPDKKPIADAVANGAELTSEIELLLKLTPTKTFAITGSDGKTTSTTLTGKFLNEYSKQLGSRTFVGGNIGTPLLTLCPDMKENDFTVLELSSFQLMTASDAPENVAITNISPNHLDWHTGMDEYVHAKKNIIGNGTRRLVTNGECKATMDIARQYAGRKGLQTVIFSSEKSSFAEIYDSIESKGNALAIYEADGYITVDDGNRRERVLKLSDIMLPGRHNVENYMTAIGLTYSYVPNEIYSSVARSFFGVEHRLELVRTLDGVRYYNSSIDSSPTRTAAALSALEGERIVLICGGYDKKIPYAPLAKAICEHGGVHTVSLTGATGEKIKAEIETYARENGLTSTPLLNYSADFADAVAFARESAKSGDCVLLSPASASFDCFKNFAQRGNVFKKLVCVE